MGQESTKAIAILFHIIRQLRQEMAWYELA